MSSMSSMYFPRWTQPATQPPKATAMPLEVSFWWFWKADFGKKITPGVEKKVRFESKPLGQYTKLIRAPDLPLGRTDAFGRDLQIGWTDCGGTGRSCHCASQPSRFLVSRAWPFGISEAWLQELLGKPNQTPPDELLCQAAAQLGRVRHKEEPSVKFQVPVAIFFFGIRLASSWVGKSLAWRWPPFPSFLCWSRQLRGWRRLGCQKFWRSDVRTQPSDLMGIFMDFLICFETPHVK